MNFKDIENLVASNDELPSGATLTDQYAYEALKSLNYQYLNKFIAKEKAGKAKTQLISRYEQQKKLDKNRREYWESQLKNIRISAETRIRLNIACKEGLITKELFLDAVRCISLMCGDTMHYESCKRELEGIACGTTI